MTGVAPCAVTSPHVMRNGRVRLDITDTGVGHIMLDHASKANAVDIPLAVDLGQAVHLCKAPTVRAVLLTAAGPNFSAGGDVFQLIGKSPSELAAWVDEIIAVAHEAILALTELDKPVVCAVQGHAVGGGMGIALAGDVVIAGESASFTTGFSRVALGLDSGVSYVLPRLVGLRKALHLAFASDTVSAAEAAQLGMITGVVGDDELMDAARAQAERFAQGPTLAYAAAKQLIRSSDTQDLKTQLSAERRSMMTVASTRDAMEGITAASERRAPSYTAH